MLKAEIDVLCSWPQRWQVTISYCSLLRRKRKMSRARSLMVNLGNKVTRDKTGRSCGATGTGNQSRNTNYGNLRGLHCPFVPRLFHLWHNMSFKPTHWRKTHTERKVVCNILRLSCVGSFSSVLETYFQVMKMYERDFNLRRIICEYYLSYTLSVNSNNKC